MFEGIFQVLSTPYGSGLSTFAAVFGFAKFWAKYIRPSAKEEVALWLQGSYKTQWYSGFLKVFKSVFGERFLSRRFFVATAIMSFSFVIIGTLIQIIDYIQHTDASSWVETENLIEFLIILFVFGLPNYLFDMLSVILSVKIFEYLGSSGYFKQIFLYLLDITTSLLIGLLAIFIFRYVTAAYLNQPIGYDLPNLLDVITNSSVEMFYFLYMNIKGIEPEFGGMLTFLYLPSILSALFTSLCALVYIFTSSFMRFFSLRAVGNLLTIDEHPVELLGISLGIALGLVTFVITALG